MVSRCFTQTRLRKISQSAGDTTPKTIPLNYYDDNILMQTVVFRFMLAFDTALDPEKLHSAFCTLAEKEGWEKIGARLRRRWV